MKNQKGFILLTSSILISVSASLLMASLEAFILEKQVSNAEYKKIQAFYQSESEIEAAKESLEKGEDNNSARLLKIDECGNRYFQIASKNSEIKAGYIFFNTHPPKGCKTSNKHHQRLWWQSQGHLIKIPSTLVGEG